MALDSTLDFYVRYLGHKLSFGRYRHSLCVRDRMLKAAEIYELDPVKAATAGLLHDVLKETDNATMLSIIRQHHPASLYNLADCTYSIYLHGPAGACFLEREFGIFDHDVLEAIAYHSGNFAAAGLLTRCLFVADMAAPARIYPGLFRLKKLFMAGHLEEAELLLTYWLVEMYQRQTRIRVHPGFKARLEILTLLVNPGADFFSRY